MKKKREKKNKFSKKIIYIIIVVSVIYNIAFLLNTTITQKDYMQIFGITFINMENNLMENDISKNDLVIVKEVSKENLKEQDIIAYIVNRQVRINKIINIKNGYTTKSNQNYYPDIEKIQFEDIIGKKVISIHGVGVMVKILQSKIISVLIFLFLIFAFLYNKYMFKNKLRRLAKKNIQTSGGKNGKI